MLRVGELVGGRIQCVPMRFENVTSRVEEGWVGSTLIVGFGFNEDGTWI